MRLARLVRPRGGGGDARLSLLPRRPAPALAVGFLAASLASLASLVLALGLTAGRLAASWSEAVAQTATLQIAAPEAEIEAQARAALAVLRGTPGITGVRVIEVDEQQALLAPWLGTEAAFDALPLPLLIEVAVTPGALDRAGLERRLASEAPGAVYDDHSAWRRPLARHALRLRDFAYGCLGLLALVLGVGVALAAGATLATEAEVVRTLRLIGAPDRVLARALGRRFLVQAAAGALLGTALAAALVAFLPAESEQGFFLTAIGLVGWQWAALAAVPAGAALTAWIAARLALARHLRAGT